METNLELALEKCIVKIYEEDIKKQNIQIDFDNQNFYSNIIDAVDYKLSSELYNGYEYLKSTFNILIKESDMCFDTCRKKVLRVYSVDFLYLYFSLVAKFSNEEMFAHFTAKNYRGMLNYYLKNKYLFPDMELFNLIYNRLVFLYDLSEDVKF